MYFRTIIIQKKTQYIIISKSTNVHEMFLKMVQGLSQKTKKSYQGPFPLLSFTLTKLTTKIIIINKSQIQNEEIEHSRERN